MEEENAGRSSIPCLLTSIGFDTLKGPLCSIATTVAGDGAGSEMFRSAQRSASCPIAPPECEMMPTLHDVAGPDLVASARATTSSPMDDASLTPICSKASWKTAYSPASAPVWVNATASPIALRPSLQIATNVPARRAASTAPRNRGQSSIASTMSPIAATSGSRFNSSTHCAMLVALALPAEIAYRVPTPRCVRYRHVPGSNPPLCTTNAALPTLRSQVNGAPYITAPEGRDTTPSVFGPAISILALDATFAIRASASTHSGSPEVTQTGCDHDCTLDAGSCSVLNDRLDARTADCEECDVDLATLREGWYAGQPKRSRPGLVHRHERTRIAEPPKILDE